VIEVHRRTGYLLLATLVAQVILISAQVRTSSGTRVLQAVTFGVFSQVQLGTAWVFGGVRGVWDGYFALRGAHVQNQQLREALNAAELRLREREAMAQRAVELERLLEIRQRTPLRTVAANVIAGDATGIDIFRTFTIDKGSSSGLRKDMAVIAPEGVVGRIVEQPPLYAAKVQLLIDREAAAGAIIERSGVGGVVVGHDRDGEAQLQLDFVSNLADAKVGDRVVTSGLDGIFPRGIVIGTLSRVDKGTGLYKQIWVTPAVDFAAVGTVLVVLDPPQATGPSPSVAAAAAAPPGSARTIAPTRSAAPTAAPGATPAASPAAPSTRPSQPPGTAPPTQPSQTTRPATPRPAPPGAASPAPPTTAPPPTAEPQAQPTAPPAAEPTTPPPTPPGAGRSRR
jgi:rod shape-determining protein MreC